MPNRKETFQGNENSTTEPDPSIVVSETSDLQEWNSQSDGDMQEASSQSDEPTHESISVRAYELWIENGRQSGFHEADWSLAEQELRAKGAQSQPKSQAASASGF